MSHSIQHVHWTKVVNMLTLKCSACNHVWEHRTDRWITVCPRCGDRDNLKKVRTTWPIPLIIEE